MNASFYFVLWQLAYLPTILLDIPFLNEYGFFIACIIVFIGNSIINKLLKNQIEYQEICEAAFIMEMVYNNDYKKYKQQALFQMIVNAAIFVYTLLLFISLFLELSNVPLIDYIIWGVLTIGNGLIFFMNVKFYIQVVKGKKIILNKEFQELFQNYKVDRGTYTFEEMLLPRPKYYQVINAANTLFAILSIVIGLLITIILYAYNGEFSSESAFYRLSLSIYGILTIYFGAKDLLSISNSQKYILLLLSCAIAVLLYMPITHYMNKDSLEAYIVDAPNLSYDVKSNVVQVVLDVDSLTSFDDVIFVKQRSMLILSGDKKLLKKIIRVGAECQIVVKDKYENEQIANIAPSELKEIYNQTKTDLEILIGIIKLDLSWGMKEDDIREIEVYDDGECVICCRSRKKILCRKLRYCIIQ